MPTISVGQPLVPGRASWPEGSDFNLYDAGLELRLFFTSPSRAEVRGVKTGTCEFALYHHEPAAGGPVFLLWHFAGIPWSDSPFTVFLVPENRRVMPSAADTGETRGVLQVILTGADDGIVRAIRAVSWSPEFTRAMLGAIRAQASTPWPGPAEYDRLLAGAYRQYPTTEAMLGAATCRTRGGV